MNNVKKESRAKMEKKINNTNIYNNLINHSLSKDENAISQLIDEMDDDADYENDEKWGDYFSFIDDKLNNSCSISHGP